MEAGTRRAVIRLAVLIGLLALYPATLLVLHSTSTSRRGPANPLALDGRATRVAAGTATLALEVRNTVEREYLMEQLVVIVLAADGPQLTLIEEGAVFAQRCGGDLRLAPGRTRRPDPLTLAVPGGKAPVTLLINLRFMDAASQARRTVQAEVRLSGQP